MSNQQNEKQESDFTSEKLTEHFTSLGYKIISITKPWRFYSISANRNNQKVIIKISDQKELNTRVQSEGEWYQQMQSFDLALKTPQLIESGELEGRNWLAVEFIEGEILCNKDPGSDTTLLEQNLDLIVDYLVQQFNLELPTGLYANDLHFNSKAIILSNIKWAEDMLDDSEYPKEEILKLIKRLTPSELLLGLRHGDLIPWHIIKNSNGLYLIDAEAAKSLAPKLFDAVYLYQRLHFTLQRPDLAEIFLVKLRERLEFSSNLERQFDFIHAVRLCGGIWEAKKQKWTDIKYPEKLLNILVQKYL